MGEWLEGEWGNRYLGADNNISAALNATVIFKSYVRQVRTWLRAVTCVLHSDKQCRYAELKTYEMRRCDVGRAVADVSKDHSAVIFSFKRHINIPVRTSKLDVHGTVHR